MDSDHLTLGVTWGTHDSSAALFHGPRLVGFVEEERLGAAKHTGEFPRRAITALLGELGATAGDVASVAFAFRSRGYGVGLARATGQAIVSPFGRRSWARVASYRAVLDHTRRRLERLAAEFPAAVVVDVPHHLCHSRYAHAASGEEHVAALVIDSIGEWRTTSLIDARGSTHHTLLHQADPHSLGYAYGAVTEHLGYRRGEGEGTVMALAALGDPERYRQPMEEGIITTAEGFRLDAGLFAPRVFSSAWPRLTERFIAATLPRRDPTTPPTSAHADLAASLQERTEVVLEHLAHLSAARSAAKTLCLSGGVAMNCLAMTRISRSGAFDHVFVPPAPGDGGTSIGAALSLLGAEALSDARLRKWDLGPSFPEREVLSALSERGFSAPRLADPAASLAAELLAGRVVGLCRGRIEAGPRALGHRSILASPLVPGITERLSAQIKRRESFRPFAPVMPVSAVGAYFSATAPSPYMSFAFAARERARSEVPTVVHRNGTARVQSLSPEDEPFLHEVLERFAAASGVPALINTSLNVKGAPIAGTPAAAVECFSDCGLDGLLLGDHYLQR